MHIVILAGGSGTRLWPLSRTQYPKQFLSLHSNHSLLQDTISRIDNIERLSIICNEEHRFLAAEQVRQLGLHADIYLEPVGRNTAPAIALVALQSMKEGIYGEQPMLVLPADHVITDTASFQKALINALQFAIDKQLVTFGILASRPETGYGYIKKAEQLTNDAAKVDKFVEKPNLQTAKAYVDSGEYCWNSGMFMFRPDTYIEELSRYRPDIVEACSKAIDNIIDDMDFKRCDKEAFIACPDESIDYAVMEQTDKAVMLPLDVGWSDIGSWDVVWELAEKDQNGNATQGDVIYQGTTNSYIHSESRLLATVGLDNVIVVDTKDAVLVADKNKVQDIKQIVQQIKHSDRSEHFEHREIYRPWGKYDSVDSSDRFQVKRITVNPGASLSVQMHHHRAEHWVVVSGTAKVTIDGKEQLITENQSVYIPVTAVHCLENPGKVPLELVEVQVGSYLGEDDIVRFKDNYGRK